MCWLHGQNTTIAMPTPLSGPGRTRRCVSGLPNTHPEFISSFVSRDTRFDELGMPITAIVPAPVLWVK